LGYGKAAVLEKGTLFGVRRAEVDYLSADYLEEELIATATINKLARRYVAFHQEIRRDDQILCRAQIKIAYVSAQGKTMQPKVIPVAVRESLASYLQK